MEPHAEDNSPVWGGKFNFEKIGRRRAALSGSAPKSKPKPEPEDESEEVRLTAKQLMRRRFERPRQIVEGLFPDLSGLLRGDLATRYAAYKIGREAGFLSVDDIRAFENMSKVPGGDTYMQPLNMAALGVSQNAQASEVQQ